MKISSPAKTLHKLPKLQIAIYFWLILSKSNLFLAIFQQKKIKINCILPVYIFTNFENFATKFKIVETLLYHTFIVSIPATCNSNEHSKYCSIYWLDFQVNNHKPKAKKQIITLIHMITESQSKVWHWLLLCASIIYAVSDNCCGKKKYR